MLIVEVNSKPVVDSRVEISHVCSKRFRFASQSPHTTVEAICLSAKATAQSAAPVRSSAIMSHTVFTIRKPDASRSSACHLLRSFKAHRWIRQSVLGLNMSETGLYRDGLSCKQVASSRNLRDLLAAHMHNSAHGGYGTLFRPQAGDARHQ